MTKLHNLDKLDIMDALGEISYKMDSWDIEPIVDKWDVKPEIREITCNSDIGYIWDQVYESWEYADDYYESDSSIYYDYLRKLDEIWRKSRNVPEYFNIGHKPTNWRLSTYWTKLHVGDPRTRQIRQNNERG